MQYLPSQVIWNIESTGFLLENTSQYQEEETLHFRIGIPAGRKVHAKLAFRVPTWACQENKAFYNQEEVGAAVKPEEWMEQIPEEQYVFETKKGHVKGYDFDTRRFRPYYRIGPMEWYYMYVKNRRKIENAWKEQEKKRVQRKGQKGVM